MSRQPDAAYLQNVSTTEPYAYIHGSEDTAKDVTYEEDGDTNKQVIGWNSTASRPAWAESAVEISTEAEKASDVCSGPRRIYGMKRWVFNLSLFIAAVVIVMAAVGGALGSTSHSGGKDLIPTYHPNGSSPDHPGRSSYLDSAGSSLALSVQLSEQPVKIGLFFIGSRTSINIVTISEANAENGTVSIENSASVSTVFGSADGNTSFVAIGNPKKPAVRQSRRDW